MWQYFDKIEVEKISTEMFLVVLSSWRTHSLKLWTNLAKETNLGNLNFLFCQTQHFYIEFRDACYIRIQNKMHLWQQVWSLFSNCCRPDLVDMSIRSSACNRWLTFMCLILTPCSPCSFVWVSTIKELNEAELIALYIDADGKQHGIMPI